MDTKTISEASELSKFELLIAFIKCFDNGEGCEGCQGCPLKGESGCAYDLKLEIARRLIGGD